MLSKGLTLAIVLTAVLVAFGAQQAATPAPEAVARAFLAELASGQFDKAAARFNEQVAAALPPARLAGAWNQLTAQFGAFHEVNEATRSEAQGQTVITLTCRFESGMIAARIPVDAQGRISGLWFGPVQNAAPWSPPDWIKTDAFEERPVTVGNAPWQLPGVLTLPKGAGPFPAVVLVHGSGPNDEDETIGGSKVFKDLAWGLATRGIAVLRYQKRSLKYGRGMAADPRATVREEVVQDAQSAVDLLASRPEIDKAHIFVLGHSLGGMLGPRIAQGSGHVAGLIVMAGNARPLEDLIVEQVRYLANLDGQVSEAEQKGIEAVDRAAAQIRSPDLKPDDTVMVLGAKMTGAYWLDLRGYRPAEAAAAQKLPVFVLRGERDYQVGMADFELWKKALAGRADARLKMYPGLNHLFVAGTGPGSPAEYARPGHVAQEVVQDIADWILAQKAPPKPAR